MVNHCIENLKEIKTLLKKINQPSYTQKLEILSDSTIGQHVRHILEFYVCLQQGKALKFVNYDKRARNLELESSIDKALETIDIICTKLQDSNLETSFIVEGNYTSNSDENIAIQSTYLRELAFCLEHSIHHQALLKIGLRSLGLNNLIDPNFGVAYATIRHKEKCAQ